MQVAKLSVSVVTINQCRYYQSVSLLFVIDFGSLVFVSYQGTFVSYRYVEITITKDN